MSSVNSNATGNQRIRSNALPLSRNGQACSLTSPMVSELYEEATTLFQSSKS